MDNLKPKKIDPERIPGVVAEKWNKPVLDEGYVPFPKRLIRCLGKVFEGPTAVEQLAVVLAIVDYRRPNLMRPPSIEYLALISGLSVERFEERLKELVEQKLIEVPHWSDEAMTVEIRGVLAKILEKTPKEE